MGTVTSNSIWWLPILSVWLVFQELTQQQNAGQKSTKNQN